MPPWGRTARSCTWASSPASCSANAPATQRRCEAQALAGGEFSSRLSDNIHQDVWEKYVFLTTLAAGTCLMRGPVGRIAATDDGADILRALLRESQAVAAASGHGAARGRRLGAEDP